PPVGPPPPGPSPRSPPARPRASCTSRATPPPSRVTWVTSRAAATAWNGCSRWTCSRTRRTSRSSPTSPDEPPSMKAYLIRRLWQSVLVLLGVSVVVFLILHLTGDPAALLLPPDATAEDLEKLRAALGFNDPVAVQYLRFLRGAVQGNFGESLRHGEPAMTLVAERLPATFQLAGASLVIALALAIPARIVPAAQPKKPVDYIATVVALLGQAMPTFWLGIMLILIFSVRLGWFPSSGRGDLEHLVLPAITLGLFTTARITRLTRSGMLEVLGQDYIRTARAKGVSEPPVVWKHALRNASIPIVTIVGIELGTLFGGSVITETIFAWPGVGRLSVQAIFNRDYPVVQAAVFLLASTFVIVNFLVDIVYTYLDPRIRFREWPRPPALASASSR